MRHTRSCQGLSDFDRKLPRLGLGCVLANELHCLAGWERIELREVAAILRSLFA